MKSYSFHCNTSLNYFTILIYFTIYYHNNKIIAKNNIKILFFKVKNSTYKKGIFYKQLAYNKHKYFRPKQRSEKYK